MERARARRPRGRVVGGDRSRRIPLSEVSTFDGLAHTLPKAIYTTRDGLASNDILRLFEDSRGDIWIGTANPGGPSRWDRATERFHRYTEEDGLPSPVNFYPNSFAEDRAGDVWIGFNVGGGLVRYLNGRFRRLTSADGLAEGSIFNLFVDSSGRLWVPTTRGGVCRIDHPEAERPTIHTYTTADGLSSDDVKAVTEDRWGRIYLGTGRGIDRLDVATGHIRHYTANEGALLGDVLAALQDRDGTLWFSYGAGLVRLVPEPELQPIPPPILLRLADLNTQVTPSTGVWHHLAAIQSTDPNIGQALYLDGNLIGTSSASIAETAIHLTFGQRGDGTLIAPFLDGLLDEMRIFSRALTAAEIQGIYNAER